MKNFVMPGHCPLTLVAPYDVASGAAALVGSIFGVANGAVASGAAGEFDVVGVFDLKKTSAQAWTQGVKIYWDNTAKECTTVSSANTLIGAAVDPAANPTPVGRVRLNGTVV